jgi:sulfate adenylyltransferase large subunit
MALSLNHFAAPAGEKPLLRISTAGSVDDGKSTLIGRLLLDSKQVWEDHLDEIGRSNVNRASRGPDLSLLTDGLRAEREQGITIDVAYRYFSTPRRKFIVADSPGHEQYTRNMATGASTAEVAIILIDARKGVLAQSHRHAFIAWLLGVRRLIFAINKMDLVDFSQDVFENIRAQAAPLLAHLSGAQADFLPVSALDGDNVVELSSRTPWYEGSSLLDLIETLHPPPPATDFRFPVQLVIRPHLDFRGYAGQIASGRVRPGDEIVALPSGRTTRVKRIVTFDGDLEEALAPLSVTLELEDELDIARGDIIAHAATPPHLTRRVVANVVWMNEHPLTAGATWLLQQGPRTVPARVTRILHRLDVESLAPDAATSLHLNDIGQVEIETAEPLVFDSYRDNRSTGGFILIDPITNLTMASGLIESAAKATERRKSKLSFESAAITPAERASLYGHHPARVDVSARPKLAPLTERTLIEQGCRVFLRQTPDVPLDPLLAAGLIVLDTQPGPVAVTGAAGLSLDDDEAVLELIERLRRASVFLDHDAVQPGEGI